MACTLIDLPPEIVHNVLKHISPFDLASVTKTCTYLHRAVAQDRMICKEVYCLALGEPTSCNLLEDINFDLALREYLQVSSILKHDAGVDEKVAVLPVVSRVTSRLLQTPDPKGSLNTAILREWFDDKRDKENRDNIEAFLCQSSTFVRSRCKPATYSTTMEVRQASAKIHVQYGMPIFCPRRAKYHQVYPYAISMVYDLRNYKTETFWGPYLPDSSASVDWEKMEAVMIVLGHNLRMFTEQAHGIFGPRSIWREPWIGACPDSYMPSVKGIPNQPNTPIDDPYNIQGTWVRVVCFLDFHDLFAYNFTSDDDPDPHSPRPALNTNEAIRMISMDLRVVGMEEPGEDDGKMLPVVFFKGTAKSMHTAWDPNANSRIRGSVRMTKEGEVRWQSISVYGGDHDVHGPAGPTAFWKLNDLVDPGQEAAGAAAAAAAPAQQTDDDDDDDEEDDEDWTEDPEQVLEAIASLVGFHATTS